MVIPNEVQVMLTMAIAGAMIMTMIYASITIPIKLLFKLRVSFASLVASISLCWAFKIFIIAPILLNIPEHALQNRWFSGGVMLLMVFIYAVFLWLLQPDSLQQAIRKDLLRKSLLKNDYLLDFYKKAWIDATKNKDLNLADQYDKEISVVREERKRIKYEYGGYKWFYKLFSQKQIKE